MKDTKIFWFYAKNLLKRGFNEWASIKTRLKNLSGTKAVEIWTAKLSFSGLGTKFAPTWKKKADNNKVVILIGCPAMAGVL